MQERPGGTGDPERRKSSRLQAPGDGHGGEAWIRALKDGQDLDCGGGQQVGRIFRAEETAGAKARKWGMGNSSLLQAKIMMGTR